LKITKFDVYINIWMAFIISAVLSFALPMISTGHLAIGDFFSGLIISWAVSFLVGLFLPFAKWGNMFAAKCGAKPGSMQSMFLANIILAFLMSVIMVLVMTWWGLHLVPDYQNIYLGAAIGSYPWAVLISYIASNIGFATGFHLIVKVLGVNPPGPPPGKN